MKIVSKKLSEIVPYERNNRIHDDQQITRIAASIKEFGFNQPVVIDKNNVIIVGHGRFFAAQKLELSEIPVVIKTELTETQKKAYRILDNKLQNDSTWDFAKLEIEFDALTLEGFDTDSWGLDKLKSLFGDEVSGDVDQEWTGMPSYDSEDETAFQAIKVHFAIAFHVQEFAKLIKQSLTDKTKSVWYPETKTLDLTQVRIVDQHEQS